MSKLTRCVALLVLLGSVLVPSSADAEGRIVVYFDVKGIERTMSSPGVGQLSTVFVFAEDFQADFLTGLQYAIDYGPHLNFVADLGLPPVYIGTSATGISMGFGNVPRPGSRALLHMALVQWSTDCGTTFNGDIVTGPHPQFSDDTPIVTRFPDQAVISADGTRSQTCQLVEVDIAPLVCPNVFSSVHWNLPDGVFGKSLKGTWIAVAVLGRDDVDIDAIDRPSVRLEGVPETPAPIVAGRDLGIADDGNYCGCFPAAAASSPTGAAVKSDEDMLRLLKQERTLDGRADLLLFFDSQDVARAVSVNRPEEGSEIELTLTGAFDDGLPFTATGCIQIVNPDELGRMAEGPSQSASLGFATPNPFNPVTRIAYSLASTQHVRLAVYDVAGRLVENLVDEVRGAGDYVQEWDAGSLPSGVYFYRLQTGGESIVRRATLLK
jgi:hypothetical protein